MSRRNVTRLDTGFAGSVVSQAEHDEVLRELVHMRGQRDAAQSALAEARAILSKAVGDNDEPHETLADCARLLVLDCDAEHERAVAAEDAVKAYLVDRGCGPKAFARPGDALVAMRDMKRCDPQANVVLTELVGAEDLCAVQAECDAAKAEAERLRAELAEQTTLAHTMEAELRTERLLRTNDANRHREEMVRVRAEAAAQRVDLARCEGCPWETRP